MRTFGILLAVALCFVGPVAAETVTIEADRDVTLIEDADGGLANGSGPLFFVGRTGQAVDGVRRGLVRFDVAAAIPENATIERVVLRLYLYPSNAADRTVRLYRVQSDWGEGASWASGGGGDTSVPGDATWLHTFYDTEFWEYSGGHFIGRASASAIVGESGYFTWDSTRHLVQDVRLWRSAPQRNFGWILIGDETERQTAKGFASREDPDPAIRPVLEVTYRMSAERQGR